MTQENKYEITEQKFLDLVERRHCRGTETRNGGAEEGHPESKCNKFCKGNYFVGGECNYGGQHLLSNDLVIINRNFSQLNELESKKLSLDGCKSEKNFNNAKRNFINLFEELENKCQDDVSKEQFFGGTCVGTASAHTSFLNFIQTGLKTHMRALRRYRDELEKTTWEKLKKFKEKEAKLGEMSREITDLAKQYQEETDPGKKREILAAWNAKKRELKVLQGELKADPLYKVFSEEVNEELANIVQNIWEGKNTLNKFLGDENGNPKGEEKFLGVLPQKWKKPILWTGVIGLIILLIVLLIKKFTGN